MKKQKKRERVWKAFGVANRQIGDWNFSIFFMTCYKEKSQALEHIKDRPDLKILPVVIREVRKGGA